MELNLYTKELSVKYAQALFAYHFQSEKDALSEETKRAYQAMMVAHDNLWDAVKDEYTGRYCTA